jgi:hypothetical protein
MQQGQEQSGEVSAVDSAYRDLNNAAAVALCMKSQHGPDSRQYRKAKLNVDAAREVLVEQMRRAGHL